MKKVSSRLLLTASVLGFSLLGTIGSAKSDTKTPLKKDLSYCEIDLDKNGELDYVFFFESSDSKKKLLITMNPRNKSKNLSMHMDFKKAPNLFMKCRHGAKLRQGRTVTGGAAKKITVPAGAYVYLYSPESSSSAVFWKNNKLQRTWLTD